MKRKNKIKSTVNDLDICCVQFSNKGEPIGMINNAYQWNTFTIC